MATLKELEHLRKTSQIMHLGYLFAELVLALVIYYLTYSHLVVLIALLIGWAGWNASIGNHYSKHYLDYDTIDDTNG